MNLFINPYNDKNTDRQKELEQCLLKNCINKEIKLIYCIVDFEFDNKGFSEDEKIVYIKSSTRPKFNDFFNIINIYSNKDTINAIVNSDIYFDEESVRLIEENIKSDECYALSRWDVKDGGIIKLFNRPDSQDCWVFKGPIKKIPDCGFNLGIPGTDNAIANRIELAGYKILNPSKDIKTYHLHNSGIRNYTSKDRIPPPYKLIHPHNLQI
jgi:hypothetical protein